MQIGAAMIFDWIDIPIVVFFAFLSVALESMVNFLTDDRAHATYGEGKVLWTIVWRALFGLVVYYSMQGIMAYLYAG